MNFTEFLKIIRNMVFELVLIICSIFEVYSHSDVHFRCSNGNYIYDSWFCDGTVQCKDDLARNDETYGCDRALCGEDKFKCTNGTCMNVTVVCNTINDCPDGSDEKNCGNEIDIKNCHDREGSFLCADKSKCIDFENTCDDFCNCLDCSDENEGCLQYDNYLCDKCSDTCYVTSNDTNSKFITPPSQNIGLTPCKACQYSIHCDNKCLYIEREKERCICDENHEANSHNRFGQETCQSKVFYENLIVYSTSNEVKLFNLTTNETKILQTDIDCTALAAAHNYVYLAEYHVDLKKGIISKTSITSYQEESIIETESKILSIAIDWITNNIYYTTNTSIMVCSEDGTTCAKLKSCSNCRVKLSPKMGLMFWNENGTLYQSHLDGSNEIKFTSRNKYYYYNLNITRSFFDVDESRDSIFFSYDPPVVEWFRFYSENFYQDFYISSSAPQLKLFDLNVFEKGIFFTVEGENVIYRQAKFDYSDSYLHTDVQVADNNATSIKYIPVYNPLLQRTKIPNPCEKATCSLCLLRPYTPFIGLNYECKCDEIHSKDGQFSCDDESHERSESIPDATAKKRDIYDVDNPPFTWRSFLWKFKSIIVIIVVIVLMIGVIYGFRKRKWSQKLRINE